ncbi:hypothetical protein QQP08_018181 [Theobroma cacao]|nr:hypothetical protein QQP08_018181 [Theobroma cacao]
MVRTPHPRQAPNVACPFHAATASALPDSLLPFRFFAPTLCSAAASRRKRAIRLICWSSLSPRFSPSSISHCSAISGKLRKLFFPMGMLFVDSVRPCFGSQFCDSSARFKYFSPSLTTIPFSCCNGSITFLSLDFLLDGRLPKTMHSDSLCPT